VLCCGAQGLLNCLLVGKGDMCVDHRIELSDDSLKAVDFIGNTGRWVKSFSSSSSLSRDVRMSGSHWVVHL
jgi:hypothetical protein